MPKLPYDVVDLNETDNKELLHYFRGERTGYVQIGPKKYILAHKYREFGEDFYSFEPRSDDVWIVTFPRSGTTVMQEMLWMVTHEFDYEEAAKQSLERRSPFLEYNILVHDGLLAEILELVKGNKRKEALAHQLAVSKVPELNCLKAPRVVKTHLPLSLVNPKLLDTCKVVYMARNPKDMAVSFYHQNRLLRTQHYIGEFPKYWELFIKDLIPWCPFWDHLQEAWEERNHPNMLFLFYEDLVKDMKGTIRKVAEHLGKDVTEDQVQGLADHLHIDNFRKVMSSNLLADEALPGFVVEGEQGFIRKGKNHGWTDYFTPEMNAEADKWIAENLKKIPGFQFPSP